MKPPAKPTPARTIRRAKHRAALRDRDVLRLVRAARLACDSALVSTRLRPEFCYVSREALEKINGSLWPWEGIE